MPSPSLWDGLQPATQACLKLMLLLPLPDSKGLELNTCSILWLERNLKFNNNTWKTQILNLGKEMLRTPHQRRYVSTKKVYSKVVYMICYQGTANENHNEIDSTTQLKISKIPNSISSKPNAKGILTNW